MAGCRSAAKYAISFMSDLTKSELRYSSEDYHELLKLHKEKSDEILCNSRLVNLQQEGIQIINHLEGQDNDMKTEDFFDTIDCVKRLHAQVNHLFNRLQYNMSKRQEKIELFMKVHLFEEEAEKVYY